MVTPSMDWIMSKRRTPASAAGLFGSTRTTMTPSISGMITGAFGSSLFNRANSGVKLTICTPRKECWIFLPFASSPMMLFARSIGIANPMPSAFARIAVLIPTTSPNSFTSVPPEFPGLIAASVCIKFSLFSGIPTSAALRFSELTMPSVTVLSSPSGLPTAMTQSPTCKSSLMPSGATGTLIPFVSIFTTARSKRSSLPFTTPMNDRPSVSVTVTFEAPFTTCAFVTSSPSSEIMKPEPCPRSVRSRGSCFCMSSPKNFLKTGSSKSGSKPVPLGTVRSVSIRTTAGPTARTAAVTNDDDAFAAALPSILATFPSVTPPKGG
mmetsp:Transcript_5253/g.14087  ORF Transcript_5253/g.14087 Transcript_5253/m.14087 type:complete len:323 (-) Transcript_5253:631-1599(-)